MGAPRLLGIDERGREILTFIEGEVVEELSEPLLWLCRRRWIATALMASRSTSETNPRGQPALSLAGLRTGQQEGPLMGARSCDG